MPQEHASSANRAATTTTTTSAPSLHSGTEALPPPHPYPGWQNTRGFDPHDPVHADGANKAFGHWFDEVEPSSPQRLTRLREVLDVGEQIVGSDHAFNVAVPFNNGVHVGAALVDVKVDGNTAFSARFDRSTLDESGTMLGERTGDQIDHPIVVRFAPTQKGHIEAVLTFRATWADARVEEQRVRLIGRARDLSDAPTTSSEAGADAQSEARAAESRRALERAQYADPGWRNAHTADGPRADFGSATQSARTAAQKIAADQILGVNTVEKQVGTYRAPPKHEPFWMDLAVLALSIATSGIAEVVAKKLAIAIGSAMIEHATDKTSLVSGLSGIIKEQVKGAGHSAIDAMKREGASGEASAANRIEFFEKQARALILLQHENAKIVDDREKYLQPVLSTNPVLATQTMTALANTFDEASVDAEEIQKSASAAQWLAYRARLANGTQQVGGDTVTDLDPARPAHPSTAPTAPVGVLDLGVEINNGVRVRSAYARGIAQAAANNLVSINLATAHVPLRLVIDSNTPSPAIITRDEAGRVRVSGDLSKLSAFNDGEGVPANEIQAERAALAICTQALERTLADRGIQVTTDDRGGRAA